MFFEELVAITDLIEREAGTEFVLAYAHIHDCALEVGFFKGAIM